MAVYDIGDQVRLSLAIVNSSAVATDPTTLSLIIKPALLAAVTYTYALAEITKDSTGNYHKDYTVLTGSGDMVYYKWTAAGTAIGVAQGSFGVRSDATA